MDLSRLTGLTYVPIMTLRLFAIHAVDPHRKELVGNRVDFVYLSDIVFVE